MNKADLNPSFWIKNWKIEKSTWRLWMNHFVIVCGAVALVAIASIT